MSHKNDVPTTEVWKLDEITVLSPGSHKPPTDGALRACVMEAVAYVAGEAWTDSPSCACPVISAFLRSWNDGLPDDETRTLLLRPLIPRLVGSRSTPEVEIKRSYLALDWLARVHTPAWLDLAGLGKQATLCRELDDLRDDAACETAQATLAAARDAAGDAAGDAAWAAKAAWDAAGDAAGDAAWGAARAAAWDAAGAAASATAWDAASAAASVASWDAAWDAARTAASAAASDAASAASWDAAWVAARATAWDAASAAASAASWDAAWTAASAAAWVAAGVVLQPTVAQLQASALGLIDRMLELG